MTKVNQIEEIDAIIQEVSRYGLRYEVIETAQAYIEQGMGDLEAYKSAYEDFIGSAE